jgi:4-hydroxybenzoate polyprenyltransferase/phosphoserine phosphatase
MVNNFLNGCYWQGLGVGKEGASWPLVIDLDGTLIKTNSKDEDFLERARRAPADFFAFFGRLFGVAARSPSRSAALFDVETWPVRQEFVEYVRAEVAAGRKVVLVTEASPPVVEAIAARFPFISEVITADVGEVTDAAARGARLREKFPEGFIYAANSADDRTVWQQASARIMVNAPEKVVREAERLGGPNAVFPRQPMAPAVFFRGLRLHQWAKNALVFVPLVMGGKIADATLWFNAVLGFIALGFAASAMYIVNDLWDLPNDRRHRTKCARPLASGDMSIRTGIALAVGCLAAGFGLAAYVGQSELLLLALYVIVTLAYSFHLKRVPILDVLVIAALFTLRLGFGILLVDVKFSPWLLVFSMFVFISLAMAKRHTEVLRLSPGGNTIPGRGYASADAPLTLGMGLAAMFGAIFILALYLIEDAFPRGVYAAPNLLWIVPPVLFLFLGRVWLLSQRGQMVDDPVAFALRDRISLVLGAVTGAGFAAALFGLPGI